MTWRDQLRVASFRGVAFHYDDDELTAGRRTVEHEHPETDGVTTEDLGRQPRRFRMTGYVLGAEFMAARDRLVEALEKAGPGTLVHPHYGERLVVVARDGVSVRHTTREGGMAVFTLTFVEVDARDNRPVAVADTEAQVVVAADAADAAEILWSGERLAVDDAPGWVVDDLLGRAESALDLLDGELVQTAGGVDAAADALARLDALRSQGTALVTEPERLVRGMIGLFGDLLGGSRPDHVRHSALAVAGSAPTRLAATAPNTTGARRRQRTLQTALVEMTVRVATVAAARAAAADTYTSRQEAEAIRAAVSEALDAALLTAPDDVYRPLTALHAATVRHLSTTAAGLVPTRTLKAAATRPALALANDLYGDDPARALALSDDLVERNRVRHPGFVPGGTDLEVLAR